MGRPALDPATTGDSPKLGARVPSATVDGYGRLARARGVRRADLVREALTRYLETAEEATAS